MLVKRRCQVHLMMMNSHDSTGERPRQPLERLVPNPKLKFMEQCREVMRFKQLAHRTEAILFCRTKNLNNQLSTLFAVAGEGRGFRTKSNHRAWRQGGQRSRDDFAGPPEGGTPNAFAECARDVAGGCGGGMREGVVDDAVPCRRPALRRTLVSGRVDFVGVEVTRL